MKHTWVTSLSVFGIIGAGSAAVLANTTVFNGVAKTEAAITIVKAETTSTTSVSTVEPTEPATTTTAIPAPVAQPYTVGNSGTVQVTNANGVLSISGALPAAGWTVQRVSDPGTWVVTEFLSPAQRVVFNAFLIDGQIQVTVDSASPETAAAVGAASNPSKVTRTSPPQTSSPEVTTKVTTTEKPTTTTTAPERRSRTPRTTVPATAPTTTAPGSDD